MKFVCISDTHQGHWGLDVPDGDVLIHAGDFTFDGDLKAIADFNKWLLTLPHKYKVVVAGNHDITFQTDPGMARTLLSNCFYLQDTSLILEGIKIYGSPWQPWFNGWAFNLRRGAEIAKKWQMIPDDTDILVTHGPAMGILDQVQCDGKFMGDDESILAQGGIVGTGGHVGCEDLLRRIRQANPRFHVCGHIHAGYGQKSVFKTHHINASAMNEDYEIVNNPIVFNMSAAIEKKMEP